MVFSVVCTHLPYHSLFQLCEIARDDREKCEMRKIISIEYGAV